MRANEFLAEAEVTPYQYTSLEIEQAMEILNQHCSVAARLIPHPIWRGFKNHRETIFTVDPSTGERQSQNTRNYYTNIMDNSPYLKGWPKRSQSLICSGDRWYAQGFGTLYAIFPYDTTKIAVCPTADLWGIGKMIKLEKYLNFYPREGDLSEFNCYLRYSLQLPEDYNGMVNTILHDRKWYDDIFRQFNKTGLTGEQFFALLQKMFSPKNAKFKLLTVEQYAANHPGSKECWMSGPVVAIKKDMWEQFKTAYQKQEFDKRIKASIGF